MTPMWSGVHLQRRGAEAGLVEQLPDRTRRPAVARAVVEDALEEALHHPVEGTCPCRAALAETDAGKGEAGAAERCESPNSEARRVPAAPWEWWKKRGFGSGRHQSAW